MGSNGYCLLTVSQSKIAVMHWSEPKSYNKPFVLLHSREFGCRGQWSSYRNSFCQSRLLTMALWPCRLLLNVQVMILVESSGFLNLAFMSVDESYLYIIIHYGMWWWDCSIGSVPRDGRPGPESFKAVDTYTYSKIIPIVPMYVPGCVKIVHMRDGSSSSSLIVNKWVGSLVLIIPL